MGDAGSNLPRRAVGEGFNAGLTSQSRAWANKFAAKQGTTFPFFSFFFIPWSLRFHELKPRLQA
jgi:hypothetical protein